jgi:large subunit ribosomal protein L10
MRRGRTQLAHSEKEEKVALLADRFRRARAALLTEYRGLTVAQLEELRGKLREGNYEFRVIKNTLARRAATEAGHPELEPELTGPLAVAFSFDDIAGLAKTFQDWVRTSRLRVEVKSALVEGRILSGEQVRDLADLPPREVLLARLLGQLQSPLSTLAALLQAPVQDLTNVLDALREAREKAAA